MVVFPSGISSEQVLAAPFLAPVRAPIDRPLTSLVLTGNQALRERLRQIAKGRGCVCRAPATVEDAWREATSGRPLISEPGLVFVDVAHPLDGRCDEARLIAEVLARRPGAMLVVCGPPSPVPAGGFHGDDERWAREMGAFVYLPGVGTSEGVALIVDEAQRIFRGQR